MKRISYDVVAVQVEKLYDFSIVGNDQKINDQCVLIEQFIISCGWDIESYLRIMLGFDKPSSN